LTVQQLPIHTHAMIGSGVNGSQTGPINNVLANSTVITPYAAETANAQMAQVITPVGGSQPHTNFQPYLCINFIISLFGIFPTQT
jgi:microcystin-dependent protein